MIESKTEYISILNAVKRDNSTVKQNYWEASKSIKPVFTKVIGSEEK